MLQEVPGVGIEPTWDFSRGILSPLRLPFRHPGQVMILRRNERSQLTQIGSIQSEGVEDRENLIDAGGSRTHDLDTDRLRVPIEVNYDLRSDLFRPDNLLTR